MNESSPPPPPASATPEDPAVFDQLASRYATLTEQIRQVIVGRAQ